MYFSSLKIKELFDHPVIDIKTASSKTVSDCGKRSHYSFISQIMANIYEKYESIDCAISS